MGFRWQTALRWMARLSLAGGLVLILATALYVAWQTWSAYQVKAEVKARLNEAMQVSEVEAPPVVAPAPRMASEPVVLQDPVENSRFLEALARAPVDIPHYHVRVERRTPEPTPTARLAQPTPRPTPQPTPTPEPGAPPVWLSIPALGIDVPVVPVEPKVYREGNWWFRTWETADYAAGYHVGTAYPGEAGNVVISGHNNIKGAVFRPISILGDPDVPFPKGIAVYVTDAKGRVFLYRFAEMYKVREAGASLEERIRNASLIGPTTEPVLTLVTCWPVTGNTHRVIVRATLVGEVTALSGEEAPGGKVLK